MSPMHWKRPGSITGQRRISPACVWTRHKRGKNLETPARTAVFPLKIWCGQTGPERLDTRPLASRLFARSTVG